LNHFDKVLEYVLPVSKLLEEVKREFTLNTSDITIYNSINVQEMGSLLKHNVHRLQILPHTCEVMSEKFSRSNQISEMFAKIKFRPKLNYKVTVIEDLKDILEGGTGLVEQIRNPE
jgi:hypothetical protein